MKLSADDLIKLLEKTLGNEDIGEEWDYMIRGTRSKDEFTRAWAQRIFKVEALYPRRSNTELFNPGGIKYLEGILAELRAVKRRACL